MRFKNLVVLFCPLPCHALYPKLLWKSNLLGGRNIIDGGFRKGNALVLSKDQRDLWMTDGAGSLHVIRLLEGYAHLVFKPTSLPNRIVESRSSVALYEGGPSNFAAYTVIDTPVGEIVQVESRVICVDTNNLLLWTTTLVGTVIGSPQITSDGKYIVVLHNLPSDGYASVLSVREGGAIVSQKPGNFLSPFGPPKLVAVNNADFLYWGESTDGGYANAGKVLHMKVEPPFEILADFLVDSSTLVAPTLSADGSSMWLVGKDASVYSWRVTGNQGRAWKQQLPLSRRNATFPIVNQVEASGGKLFVASATNSFHCLNADNGEVLWSASLGPSIYMSSAKYSSNDNVVYSIQHLTGKVVQHHADTGDVLWHYDCVNVTRSRSCMDSVEAEPSLSKDGSTLYYGDIYGTVYALVVSDVLGTGAPSNEPTAITSRPMNLTSFPLFAPIPGPSLVPTSTASQHPLPSPTDASIPQAYPSATLGPTKTISEPASETPTLGPTKTISEPTSGTPTLGPTKTISEPESETPILGPTKTIPEPASETPTLDPTKTKSEPASASPTSDPTRTLSGPSSASPTLGSTSVISAHPLATPPTISITPSSPTSGPTLTISQHPLQIPSKHSIPPSQSPTFGPKPPISHAPLPTPSHTSTSPTLTIPTVAPSQTTVAPNDSQQQKEEVGQKAPIGTSDTTTIRYSVFSVSIALAVVVI